MEIARLEVPPRASAVLCKHSGASDLRHAVYRLRNAADIQRMRCERFLHTELDSTAYIKVAVTYQPVGFDFIVSNYDEASNLLIIHDFEAESNWFGDLNLLLRDSAEYRMTARFRPQYVIRDDGARIHIDPAYTSLRMLEGRSVPVLRVYEPDQAPPTLYQEVVTRTVAIIPLGLSLLSPNLIPFMEDVVRYHGLNIRLAFERGEGQKRLD